MTGVTVNLNKMNKRREVCPSIILNRKTQKKSPIYWLTELKRPMKQFLAFPSQLTRPSRLGKGRGVKNICVKFSMKGP